MKIVTIQTSLSVVPAKRKLMVVLIQIGSHATFERIDYLVGSF